MQIVEKNPAKFRIDPSELAARKAFILQTRNEVNTMKETTENGGHCLRADHHGVSEPTLPDLVLDLAAISDVFFCKVLKPSRFGVKSMT